MPEEKKSFWSTIPGIITAIATLITAVGGFLVVLNQIGMFGTKQEPKKEKERTATGTADQSQVERLSSSDMQSRQMELEAKLREMEQRLARERQQSAPATGTQQQAQPFQDIAQLEGTWYFDNGAYWTIAQHGVSVSMQEYSFLFGQQILTAGGKGTIVGRKAFFEVSNLSGGSGKAELSLSSDLRTLTGVLKDPYGNTLMSLYLTRSFDID